MYGLILVIHVLVALFLIAVVLLQGGRGGLGEALGGAAVQSLFGGGANTVMTKLTAGVAALFMVTCLSLAALSTSRGRASVMDRLPAAETAIPLPSLPAAPAPVPAGGLPPAPASAATPDQTTP